MSVLNVAIELNTLFCYHGWDSEGDSEPYIWTVFFKIDGSTITSNPDPNNNGALLGMPSYFTGPGSHGNLGQSIGTGETIPIPQAVGRWATTLQPLELVDPNSGETVEIPGIIGVIAVLMEDNYTPEEDIEVGHAALNKVVMDQLNSFVSGIDLYGVSAEVKEYIGKNPGTSIPDATQAVFTNLFAPTQNVLQTFAGPLVFYDIFNSLGFGGEVLSALSSDKPQGQLFHLWTQTDLAATSQGPVSNGMPPIVFTDFLSDPTNPLGPAWAYNVHGQALQLTEVWTTPIPEGVPPGRWPVSGIGFASTRNVTDFIYRIGGTLPDGTAWWVLRTTAVGLIQNGTNTFFVAGADGSEAEVIVSNALHRDEPYLTTQGDASKEDNLASLPECAITVTHTASTA